METREEDKIRILDITRSINEIRGYVGRSDYDSFAQREDIREAVTSHLLQIGGAAAMLSDEFKDKYADVDWDVLKGLQYANYDQELEMDLHPQWHIVNNDLPEMMDQLMNLSLTLEREEALENEIGLEDYPEDTLDGMPTFTEQAADLPEVRMDLDDDEPFDDDVDEDEDFDDDIFDENVDVDNLDVEDDSFIDRRFTDDDLMEDSSLDDDIYEDDEEIDDDDEF
jgi:uncharacterized protein with HEPN domain